MNFLKNLIFRNLGFTKKELLTIMKKKSTMTAIGIAAAVATAGAAAMMAKSSPSAKRKAMRRRTERTIDSTVSAIGGAVDAIASKMSR